MENYLQNIIETYSETQMKACNVSMEALTREMPALFMRIGKAIILCKDFDVSAIPFAKIEHKMRTNLKSDKLPQAVTQVADETETTKKQPKQ